MSDGFNRFRAAWPKGWWKATKRAMESWEKLDPDEELIGTIVAALEAQKRGKQWREGYGIPHPATWLNQSRWTDEVDGPPGHDRPPGSKGGPVKQIAAKVEIRKGDDGRRYAVKPGDSPMDRAPPEVDADSLGGADPFDMGNLVAKMAMPLDVSDRRRLTYAS